MNTTINLNTSDTGYWPFVTAAHRLGWVHSVADSWATDAPTPTLAGKTLYHSRRGEQVEIVVEALNALISLNRYRRDITCTVVAADENKATNTLAQIQQLIPKAERRSKLLNVTFWYHTVHGPRSYVRQLQAPNWKDIEANYATPTRERLTALQSVELNEDSGKLILWQGEPGTGKTFALRALGEEWADWCTVHYVLDPENFFTQGDYLLNVILGDDAPPSSGPAPWRLVVLEDAGEMLAKDAKLQVGQGLARLLNLCDGLLGQGLRVLVLITTNEQVGSLHAAVSRPGRCLSQISFERFSAAEATKWLAAHNLSQLVNKPLTLADLYALKAGRVLPLPRQVGLVG